MARLSAQQAEECSGSSATEQEVNVLVTQLRHDQLYFKVSSKPCRCIFLFGETLEFCAVQYWNFLLEEKNFGSLVWHHLSIC